MTGEFEIAGISTGTWWSSPTNAETVFSGYSLTRPTENISLDISDFGWQNFDNKFNDRNDDLLNIHNSFFDGLFDPNEQIISDSWAKTTIPDSKSELLESLPFLDNTFLIDSEAESFLDHEIRNYKSKEQITQDSKNLITKKSEESEENVDEYSPRMLKRPRIETLSSLPSFKVRKEKLGDRITALQQLVSPFGKTDTASVLNEAVEYIKFLQEQVTVLSNPDQNTRGSVQRQQFSDKKSINTQEEEEECSSRKHVDLASRGLCLMPISTTYPVAAAAASAAEMNTSDFWNFPFSVNV
ncbi:hypothetical protein EUTSA_v10029319mg [Eutrema salsugineum]|uniref:BHLH domain-containing protein n=1 Tax=Eutrema salsugineum TaxID=72664 RepID=V4L6X4_EUTSA|nr:hypothetical protein EUTSA_v10029319mg [Eutrema salsugineum]